MAPGATSSCRSPGGGGPANGRSYDPSIDGYSERGRPHCVAFISDASNLVRGDTNGQPDAFVRNLRTHATIRVSVDSRGRQADGPTPEVSIDGHCTRVGFTSRATNMAMTRMKVRKRRPAVTARPRPGTSQVYCTCCRGSRASTGRGATPPTSCRPTAAGGRATATPRSRRSLRKTAGAWPSHPRRRTWRRVIAARPRLSNPVGLRAQAARNPAFSRIYMRYVGAQ